MNARGYTQEKKKRLKYTNMDDGDYVKKLTSLWEIFFLNFSVVL